MPALAAMLSALLPWVISKTVIQLGIGIISFAGWVAIINIGKGWLTSAIAGVPADAMAVITLSGAGDGIAWVLAAITTRVTIQSLPRLGLLPSV